MLLLFYFKIFFKSIELPINFQEDRSESEAHIIKTSMLASS
jgi:hypothetical protein